MPDDIPVITAVHLTPGDSPEMADDQVELILSGRKTATCAALRDFGPSGMEMPIVGRRDTVIDGSGRPAAVIETLEVAVRRFDEIDLGFAHAEGEPDKPVKHWRRDHADFWRRNGGFSPQMELVCERFRVVRVFDRS